MTLEELIDRLRPSVAREFRAAMQDVTDRAVLAQVEDALRRNDIEGAFRAIGYSPAALNRFLASISVSFENSGVFVVSTFPSYVTTPDGLKTPLRFNMRDPRAEQWLRDESASLVTQIEDEVRNAVRETAAQGLRDGRNPRSIALDIIGRYNSESGHREGGVVGLGTRELAWMRSAEQRLRNLDPKYFMMKLRDERFDSIVRSSIEEGRPISESTISRLMTRYKDNALRHRGENIARTEVTDAANRSEYLATLQAVEQGQIPADAVKRIWDSTGDAVVRPSHKDLDGQTVGIDEPFISPLGSRMMHPGDRSLGARTEDVAGCRCRVRTEVDWLAGVS